jgi:hypothetical protein
MTQLKKNATVVKKVGVIYNYSVASKVQRLHFSKALKLFSFHVTWVDIASQ